MSKPAKEVFDAYLAAQAEGDMDMVMQLISDDAVFDVGRGRYRGDGIRQFHDRLQAIHSVTTPIKVAEPEPNHITALLDQYDDDLKPLGIEKIQLEADVVTSDGKIQNFTARPNSASLALIAAARAAGRTSEGVELAEQAGNLPSQVKPADNE